MGRVDAARGGVEESRSIVSRVGAEVVSGGEEPEESVDTAIGGEREVSEAEHAVAKTGGVASGIFASIAERREQSIAGVEASAEQFLGDGDALSLVAEVLDDAEEVARVDPWGQGAEATLGLEDGDALDDDVERVARDGDTEVALRVEELELLEGVIEESAHPWVLSRQGGQSRAVLLLATLIERGARCVDLLSGDGLVVELDAGASPAIVARAMVEGARPGLRDERKDLTRELSGVLGV